MSAPPRAALAALAALLAAAAAVSGCESTRVRVGSTSTIRVPIAASSPEVVFGHQVAVRTSRFEYMGELIGCDARGVYVQLNTTESGERYQYVDGREVVAVRVRQPGAGPALLVWTILGTLSTLSHGVWLIASAPVWSTTGAISTALGWSPGFTATACQSVSHYARFPQGVPAAMRARFVVATRDASGGEPEDDGATQFGPSDRGGATGGRPGGEQVLPPIRILPY